MSIEDVLAGKNCISCSSENVKCHEPESDRFNMVCVCQDCGTKWVVKGGSS